MRKILKFLTGRLFIVSALISIQIVVVALFALYLTSVFVPVLVFFLMLNFIIVAAVLNRNDNPMFKVAWIIPVLIFPVCGALFYILFGRTQLNRKNRMNLKTAIESAENYTNSCKKLPDELCGKDSIIRQAKYITYAAKSEVFQNTQTEYFSPGELFFERLLEELKRAEDFIFMEYFIVEEGYMWDKISDILINKIERGVEVWFMFDDIGSISKVNVAFPAKLRKLGVKTAVFNPFKPSMDSFLNYRDHRKYTIIDGKAAFTGGINLADEYIGAKQKFGFWQDSAIMLKGDAVNRITISFLQIWYFTTGELPDYERYQVDFKTEHDGYVIPFSDEPLDREFVSESAYINLIEGARDYVYICTPYLIIDEVMSGALIRASKSGVRVKIMTPHIPDKRFIFYMTQSNYSNLIDAGIEIYEFKPGFLHTKAIVADDITAIVGTANFDYRSFYLHFENGVWLYKSKAVAQVKDMFISDLKRCIKIDKDFTQSIPLWKRMLCSVMRMFAPLM